jgi:dTDP-4-amino-4,6-dideoxygalactose transaminase
MNIYSPPTAPSSSSPASDYPATVFMKHALPLADALSEAGMNLPTFSALTDSQLEFVADASRQEHR